jgi:biotin carboxyl carrier protein
MKLALTSNGVEGLIDLIAPGPDCRFRIDASPEMRADVEEPEPGVYSVLLDGRSYEARVEETPSGLVVVIDGYRFEVSVRDPRKLARKGGGGGGEGVQAVTAPMPGKVVRVLAAAGEDVAAGQGLVVVEAMKMQNELKSPRAGRVLSMAAREGATVTAGEVLVTIE